MMTMNEVVDGCYIQSINGMALNEFRNRKTHETCITHVVTFCSSRLFPAAASETAASARRMTCRLHYRAGQTTAPTLITDTCAAGPMSFRSSSTAAFGWTLLDGSANSLLLESEAWGSSIMRSAQSSRNSTNCIAFTFSLIQHVDVLVHTNPTPFLSARGLRFLLLFSRDGRRKQERNKYVIRAQLLLPRFYYAIGNICKSWRHGLRRAWGLPADCRSVIV